MKIALLAALYVFSDNACALPDRSRDFGVLGPVYPIAEPDMLETIHRRLKELQDSGELDRLEQESRQRARQYVERPPGITLPPATTTRVHYVDPAVTVPYDIEDHEGRIIHPAGTTINPLKYKGLSRRLLFIDGDRPEQVEWAKRLYPQTPTKVILVNGPIMELMQAWGEPLYFDQGGRLVEYFEIESLPASVVQDGERLRVDEVRLEKGR